MCIYVYIQIDFALVRRGLSHDRIHALLGQRPRRPWFVQVPAILSMGI